MRHWLTDEANREQTRMPRLMTGAALLSIATMGLLHVAWALTGAEAWLVGFRLLTTAFLVVTAALSVALSLGARRFFSASDPLRVVWSLLVLAAIVRFGGHGLSHVVPNWMALIDGSTPSGALVQLTLAGRVIAGPLHMALVAIALALVVRLCRRLGLLVGPSGFDLLLIAATALYAVQFLRDLVTWRAAAAAPAGLLDILSWTSDPLLAILLAEAIVLRRAAVEMGASYVSRCWGAFAAAIFLTSVGDAGFWLEARGYVTWPWRSLFWYVWPIAEMAWALGPAWQLVACRSAQRVDMQPQTRAEHVRPQIVASPIVRRFTPMKHR